MDQDDDAYYDADGVMISMCRPCFAGDTIIWHIGFRLLIVFLKKVSEFDKEIPQSRTNQLMAR